METTPISTNSTEQIPEQLSVEERWQKARKDFDAKKVDFLNYLQKQDIWDETAYPKTKEKILARKNLTEDEKKRIIEEIRKKSLELAEAAMNDDANLYEGIKILESLGEIESIKERAKQGHRMITGELHYDLAKVVLEHGSDEQAEAMLKDWLKERGQTNLTDFEDTKYFRERLFIINDSFNAFANAHGLPDKLPDLAFEGSKTGFINAAMELKKRNYDVAIGVLKSGVYLAEL